MTKLTATYEGQTFKRSTERPYTHIIIGKIPGSTEGTPWKALSWASSLLLAQKALSQFKRYTELKIIPVNT